MDRLDLSRGQGTHEIFHDGPVHFEILIPFVEDLRSPSRTGTDIGEIANSEKFTGLLHQHLRRLIEKEPVDADLSASTKLHDLAIGNRPAFLHRRKSCLGDPQLRRHVLVENFASDFFTGDNILELFDHFIEVHHLFSFFIDTVS